MKWLMADEVFVKVSVSVDSILLCRVLGFPAVDWKLHQNSAAAKLKSDVCPRVHLEKPQFVCSDTQ